MSPLLFYVAWTTLLEEDLMCQSCTFFWKYSRTITTQHNRLTGQRTLGRWHSMALFFKKAYSTKVFYLVGKKVATWTRPKVFGKATYLASESWVVEALERKKFEDHQKNEMRPAEHKKTSVTIVVYPTIFTHPTKNLWWKPMCGASLQQTR